MTDHQHAVPDCAGRNGALDWTVHQYGYERYVVPRTGKKRPA
jgi:hypothetical protein